MEKRCRFQVCPRRWFASSLYVVSKQGNSLFYYKRKVSFLNLISLLLVMFHVSVRHQTKTSRPARNWELVSRTEFCRLDRDIGQRRSNGQRLYEVIYSSNKLITRQFHYLSVSLNQVFDWSDDTVQKVSIDRPFRPIAQGLLFFLFGFYEILIINFYNSVKPAGQQAERGFRNQWLCY